MSEPSLYLDYAGEEHELHPPVDFRFGRHASSQLVVDDTNMHLHRRLGRFAFRSGIWWLINEGRHIEIEVRDSSSRAVSVISPGTRTALHFESFSVWFTAGPTTYEFLIDQPDVDHGPEFDDEDESRSSEATVTTSSMPLTENQFALILACARPQLIDSRAPMPTTRVLADGLGWSVKKFDRQLDNICVKFTQMGFAGLQGTQDKKAQDRKSAIAELAIRLNIVGEGDLA